MRFSDALTYTFVICFFSSTICEKTTRARRYNITEDLLPSSDETYLDKKKKKYLSRIKAYNMTYLMFISFQDEKKYNIFNNEMS